MLPIWFFVILFLVIGYLLYITRTTEETLADMSRTHFRKIQFWMKELSNK